MSIEERLTNANQRINAAEQKKSWEERAAQKEQKRKGHRRNYIIGELVARYFPDVQSIEPGTISENQARFESLEAFLYILSTEYDLVEKLRERAAKLMSEDPDGEWRISV